MFVNLYPKLHLI